MDDLASDEHEAPSSRLNRLRRSVLRAERVLRSGARGLSKLRRDAKDQLGLLDPPRIDLYIGLANARHLSLRGRALEDPPLREPRASDSPFSNLVRSVRLLETDELADLEVEVSTSGKSKRVVTGEEGFFEADFDFEEDLEPGWHGFTARALGRHLGKEFEGRFYVPEPSPRFGVISDIDDTILKTHVRNIMKMVFVTLLGNALTRLSFDGASEFYRALAKGGQVAPFFYVSRSAWNIHNLLEHFISHHGFPEGPLLLRDAGVITPPNYLRGSKSMAIEKIFRMHPELDFVLIGDSGQRDADIYAELYERHPGSVRAILIRNVTAHRHTRKARATLAKYPDCPSLVFDSSDQALEFCRELGLLSSDTPSR